MFISKRFVPLFSQIDTQIERYGIEMSSCKRRHTCQFSGCTNEESLVCRCDHLCMIYGDCCVDYETQCRNQTPNQEALDLERFIRILDLNETSFSCIAPNEDDEGFLMISTCPHNFKDSEIANNCMEPMDSAYDRIPVIIGGKLTFRNVFCAICNGIDVQNVSTWDVIYYCERDDFRQFYEVSRNTELTSSFTFLKTHCQLSITPPKTLLGSLGRACYPGVKDCTDKLHEAYEACKSYFALIYYNDSGHDLFFKNPHCALCNFQVKKLHSNSLFCARNYFPGYGKLEFNKFTRFPGLPLSVLFDFGASSNVRVTYGRTELINVATDCRKNEILDLYSGMCQKLGCQEGFMLLNNTCVPSVTFAETQCSAIEIEINISCRNTPCGQNIQQLCLEQILNSTCMQAIVNITYQQEYLSSGVHAVLLPTTQEGDVERCLDQILLSEDNEFGKKCGFLMVNTSYYCNSAIFNANCVEQWNRQSDLIWTRNNDRTMIYVNETATWWNRNDVIVEHSYVPKKNSNMSKSYSKTLFITACMDSLVLQCPSVSLNKSAFKTFYIDDEKWLALLNTSVVFAPGDYVTNGNSIRVCSERLSGKSIPIQDNVRTFYSFSKIQVWVSLFGNIASISGSSMTIATYYIFPELRNCGSVLIMGFVTSLIVSQTNFIISGYLTLYPMICSSLAAFGHYSWLSGFTFMNVIAFDLSCTFGSIYRSTRIMSIHRNRYYTYFLYALGTPLLVIVPCVGIHYCQCSKLLQLTYGDEHVCWIRDGFANLVVFGCPLGLYLMINILFFIRTIRGIRKSRLQTRLLRKLTALQNAVDELKIYLKVS